jgi:hypothetical protein
MGFEQYHEPPEELSHKTRTFARMIASLIEDDIVERGEAGEKKVD